MASNCSASRYGCSSGLVVVPHDEMPYDVGVWGNECSTAAFSITSYFTDKKEYKQRR